MKKLWILKVRIIKNDQHEGKRIQSLLQDLLAQNAVSDCLDGSLWIWQRGRLTLHRGDSRAALNSLLQTLPITKGVAFAV